MDSTSYHSSSSNHTSSSPTATNSRVPLSSRPSPSHGSSEGQNTSFAFLVHSQDTIPNNLPPNVDNKPLARQRRRRTSPEDQAILEEEFLRDSKPDKNARKRIVERVALGEKEVQIWFQNRRQNCRRKTRPLLPHEILSHLQASREATGPASATMSLEQFSDDAAHTPEKSNVEHDLPNVYIGTSATMRPEQSGSDVSILTSPVSQEFVSSSPLSSGIIGLGITLPQPMGVVRADTLPPIRTSGPTPTRQLTTNRPLSVADLISPEPKSATTSPQESEPTTAISLSSSVETKPTLKRSRSHLRLSLTSDGAAKIMNGEESSPSPPRSQTLQETDSTAPNTLRRTFSAASLSNLNSPRVSESNFGLRRVPSGRSRDSRSWEFWCDNDARNELQKKAEQERLGSAVDAIGLIRSSSRGPLTPNLNKANAAVARLSSAKRAKTDTLSKPLLGRAQSSIARLQGTILPPIRLSEDKNLDKDEKLPKVGADGTTSSNSDSDKENWEPDVESAAERRRRILQARVSADAKRPVLRESLTFSGRSGSLRSLLNDNDGGKQMSDRGMREGKDDKENLDPEEDDEIARFMGKSRPKTSPSKVAGEDMDCIQGLLSLSQGAWR